MSELRSKILECKDISCALRLFEQLNPEELSSHHFLSLSRNLKKLIQRPDLKIAYLGNFTLDILPQYVNVYAATAGLQSDTYVGAYNQYFQEVLSPTGPLVSYDPDIIFLALAMKQLASKVAYSFTSLSVSEKKNEMGNIVNYVDDIVNAALKHTDSTVILCNFQLPQAAQSGIADWKDDLGEVRFYFELNIKIAEIFQRNPRVFILDTARLSAKLGSDQIYDPKLYFAAKVMWSGSFCQLVAKEILKFAIAIKGLTRKCLVLDLDNTLWGGIIGEDGALGVKIGQGDSVAEAYLEFQHGVKALKSRGILLAICSKNNEKDVEEVFSSRAEMPLKLSDFSAIEVNWDYKHISIQRIADKLNIGVSSMVFIDDNPAECSLVRQMLPMVKTIELPAELERIPSLINSLVEFEKGIILQEDRVKTEQYLREEQRKELKKAIGSLDEYLHGLKTEVTIKRALGADLDRMHQLFSKTNQFNLTTKRYTINDIQKFMASGRYDLFVFSAKDVFGEMGIIGLYLIEVLNKTFNINSFILSCRAMGRGIETAIMNYIKSNYLRDSGTVVSAEYIPTNKNRPTKDFYVKEGFTVTNTTVEGAKYYMLESENCSIRDCSWIKVKE